MIPLWPVPEEPIDDDPVVYARSISGPMGGLVKPVKCRTCRKALGECECVPGPRGGVAA